MELSKDDLLAVLTAALSKFREELGPEVTAARLLTLITVVRNPGMYQAELGTYVPGLSQQALSRNALELSDRTPAQTPGPDLIRVEPDAMYRRRNVLNPTTNASKLLTGVANDVNKVLRNRAKAN